MDEYLQLADKENNSKEFRFTCHFDQKKPAEEAKSSKFIFTTLDPSCIEKVTQLVSNRYSKIQTLKLAFPSFLDMSSNITSEHLNMIS